jgi:hypothetical protein
LLSPKTKTVSHSWAFNRLLLLVVWLTGLFGSRVRHDAPGALRGSFFHSEHVAAGGAFSGHLPFVAFCLSGPLSLSLVVFLLCELSRLSRRSVRSLTVATSLPVR